MSDVDERELDRIRQINQCKDEIDSVIKVVVLSRLIAEYTVPYPQQFIVPIKEESQFVVVGSDKKTAESIHDIPTLNEYNQTNRWYQVVGRYPMSLTRPVFTIKAEYKHAIQRRRDMPYLTRRDIIGLELGYTSPDGREIHSCGFISRINRDKRDSVILTMEFSSDWRTPFSISEKIQNQTFKHTRSLRSCLHGDSHPCVWFTDKVRVTILDEHE